MAWKSIIVAGVLMCANQLQAEESTDVSVRELMSWCSDGSAAGALACTAYIAGIADAAPSTSSMFCPGRATRDQIRVVVMRYIAARPWLDQLEMQAVIPVTLALQEAFPCPK